MIIHGNLPLNVVSNSWLQRLVQAGYIVPQRKYVLDKIVKPMYEETKQVIKVQLTVAQCMGLTMDHWTSGAHHPYGHLSDTISTDNWEMMTFDLGTFSFSEAHTGR